jgi:uridine kinase
MFKNQNPFRWYYLGLLAIKWVIGMVWINTAQVEAVYRFVSVFGIGQSPWEWYYAAGQLTAFPYPPLMLYIFKLAFLPASLTGIDSIVFLKMLYLIPIIIADSGIYFWMRRMFPSSGGKTLFFYFASPIVLYASYVMGALDSIALFFLLIALNTLKKRAYLKSAILLGLAFSVKIPIIFALPLILTYVMKTVHRDRIRRVLTYTGTFFASAAVIALPFLFQESFWRMVYLNPDQSVLYALSVHFGERNLYVAFLAVLMVYARFLMYEKINRDLFYNFLAVIYAIFVLLVPPAENWYLWTSTLCAVLFVGMIESRREAYILSALFSTVYIFFFIIVPGVGSPLLTDLVFTIFEGTLLSIIYVLYKYGIKSNQVYKKRERATVIGIGGDSGVGKSTLKSSITGLLGEAQIVAIESDGDHKWARGDSSWDSFTHLNPKANYLYRQAEYVKQLKNGSSIERREYDHASGTFTSLRRVYPNDYILLAGLHPFYLPQMRKTVDLKIYIDTEEALRRHWKIRRDMETRGYDRTEVLKQLEERESDSAQFIQPQRQYADLIVHFYSDDEFEPGDAAVDPALKLDVFLRLDTDIESVADFFTTRGYALEHTYASDMQFQKLNLQTPIASEDVRAAAEALIPNLDELLSGHEIVWADAYHGFLQFLVLVLLSNLLRKGDEHEA